MKNTLGLLTSKYKKFHIAKQLFQITIEMKPDFADSHYYFLLSQYEFNAANYDLEFNYLLIAHKYYFISEKKRLKSDINFCTKELPKVKDLKFYSRYLKNVKPIFIIGVPRCGSSLKNLG